MMTNKTLNYISKSPEDTKRFGANIASKVKGGEVICLFGDLGSGKTIFVQGFVHYFLPKKRVLSPTFIIVRHYSVNHLPIKHIYHVDLYRLAKKTEVNGLGLSELINDPKSVFLIEWPQKTEKMPTKNRIEIKFLIRNESERKIQICYPKI